MNGFTTKSIHGGIRHKDAYGALRMPVYDSVAFEFASAQDIEMAFEGKKPAHAYSRISNPTVEDFEQRIRMITDAQGVVAVSSGMAAISTAILAIAGAGTNIVTTRFLFGNTYSLFEKTLKSWGLSVVYVDMNDFAAIAGAVNDSTRCIFLETITNPQLQVADISAIAGIARLKSVPLIIDGTLTTPYLFKSKNSGVDIEVLSSTKYLSGGATSVGGLIIDNGTFDWKKSPKLADESMRLGPFTFLSRLRREVYRNIGTCLSPHNAYLQALGLETMPLRIERSSANALALAEFLVSHPRVASVNYPGLRTSHSHEIAQKQFSGRFGSLLTFELASKEECFRCIDRLKIIRRSTNLHDNKTLILHPASTIFCEYSPEHRLKMGVPETMLRVAVGIEDCEDVINDLNEGLG